MEKLFKVICANFALQSKKPLKCERKFENLETDAKMYLIGNYVKMSFDKKQAIKDLSVYLGITNEATYKHLDDYQNNKTKRFAIKNGLIQNGMRL